MILLASWALSRVLWHICSAQVLERMLCDAIRCAAVCSHCLCFPRGKQFRWSFSATTIWKFSAALALLSQKPPTQVLLPQTFASPSCCKAICPEGSMHWLRSHEPTHSTHLKTTSVAHKQSYAGCIEVAALRLYSQCAWAAPGQGGHQVTNSEAVFFKKAFQCTSPIGGHWPCVLLKLDCAGPKCSMPRKPRLSPWPLLCKPPRLPLPRACLVFLSYSLSLRSQLLLPNDKHVAAVQPMHS